MRNRLLLACVAFSLMPGVVSAACGYAESGYYGQSGYYTQATYQTTFTRNTYGFRNVFVNGAISKGSGTFVIDHPLDPANSLLYHSFVESPDAKNWYDGTATLEASGNATIALPDYFQALNHEYRYQLTPIGAAMPGVHVARGVVENEFIVAGGVPNGRISWQITGIRKDPYILENPITVEVEKGIDTEVGPGAFMHEDVSHGLRDLGIWVRHTLEAWGFTP